MKLGAIFSQCRLYRYALWRVWSDKPALVVIGLNPSTATENTNDPTVTRCQRRAEMLGCGGLWMLNLFAWRSTDPSAMKAVARPVQPVDSEENDVALRVHTRLGLVVCGWGNHGEHRGRDRAVRELLADRDLHALKVNGTGQPQHPLYLPYSLQPTLWIPARRSA